MEENKKTIPNTQEKNIKEQEISKEDMKAYKSAVKYKKEKKTRKKLVLSLVIIAFIIGLIIIRGTYLTAKDLGERYLEVYHRKTLITLGIFIINYFLVYWLTIRTNKKIRKILKNIYEKENKNMPKFANKSIAFVIALITAAVSTLLSKNMITKVLGLAWFGQHDPIYNLDISWFVLVKPLMIYLLTYFTVLMISSLIYGAIYSIIVVNTDLNGISRNSFDKQEVLKIIGFRVRLIAILIGLILLVTMAGNIGNEKFVNIEKSDGEIYSLYGAGYIDGTIKKIGYIIFAFVAMISIFKIFSSIKEGSIRRAVGYVLIVPVYLILLAALMAISTTALVGNNTLEKNEWYINKNIELTNSSYNIKPTYTQLNYTGTITDAEIAQNKNILDNTRLVNDDLVLQDVKYSQTSKGYYAFRKTQLEMYNSNNLPTLYYITPREISTTNATYTNKTYQYTHGYGIMATYSGKTDENGNLITAQKEFGNLENSKIKITEPRIYYGLETNSAVVLNSAKQEADYVDENGNSVDYNYNGNSGLSLNFLDRLILAINQGDMKLAFSGSITKSSKYLINRNILNRVKTILPDIIYDDNPYIVIDNQGKQYWVIDGYTTSNSYPFAQKMILNGNTEINYIRNSVKVIINAFDGTTKFYITDRTDPIIMSYNNIYPDLFEKKDSTIPSDISSHFVYPKKLFNIQSKITEIYHNTTSGVLYRGNDIWNVAKRGESFKNSTEMDSYYTMVKDDKGNDCLGLVIPFTVYGKQNIIAYMVGTIENGEQKLQIKKFQDDSNVLGPISLEAQINQDETISQELASLNVSGTKITSDLIILPIENTLLYIKPIYQQLINETTQKPQLKRVVVASGNKVGIGDDINLALKNLLSKKALDINTLNADNIQDNILEVINAYKKMKESSKNSDWKLYGEDMDKLTKAIDQLEVTSKKQKENKIAANTVATH